jgi:hypothetical protein
LKRSNFLRQTGLKITANINATQLAFSARVLFRGRGT